jgi:hypothetical protein
MLVFNVAQVPVRTVVVLLQRIARIHVSAAVQWSNSNLNTNTLFR